MASKIPQLPSKMNQVSQVVSDMGVSHYKLLLEKNKHYIQDPPTIEKCQSMAKQLFYTRLARCTLLPLILHFLGSVNCSIFTEQLVLSYGMYYGSFSIPHRYDSFWKELNHAKNLMKNWKDLNKANVGFAALFRLECFAWFWGAKKPFAFPSNVPDSLRWIQRSRSADETHIMMGWHLLCSRASLSWTHWATVAGGSTLSVGLAPPSYAAAQTHQASTYVVSGLEEKRGCIFPFYLKAAESVKSVPFQPVSSIHKPTSKLNQSLCFSTHPSHPKLKVLFRDRRMQDPALFQPLKPHFPEQEQLKCPRCDSINTKFCYYNNYNLSQPRHFCKNCRRYWTKGGALRNIPVGGGSRKNAKRSSSSTNTKRASPSPVIEPDPNHICSNPVGGGSFGSLLASTGHLGNLLEGLKSSGANLKAVQMEEFGENVSSGHMADLGSGRNPVLEIERNGNAESFLSMQNGDSSCWNGTNAWSNLAIFTPGSSYEN
ncbi:unnamed protein product [Sphenostylis stenocarpa]|uniref:Dof zinc finger protein n=1 Tax=Sphenostylis stenocarpa TaxID=92480 RepID=A0AA86SHX4_9FABA|nr:unnamed protein product [Sphenostylis stenocarpa]